MKLQKQSLTMAILFASAAASAATPTTTSGTSTLPIAVSGTIAEVVACSFGGGATNETNPGTVDGLSFAFGTVGDQYNADASEDLTITCSDDATGNSYNIAMTVAESGASEDFDNKSSSFTVSINGTDKTATLSASEDATTYSPVDQVATSVSGTGSVTYNFRATIADPGSDFGAVASASSPSLYVKFDAESTSENEIPGFPF